MTVTDQDLDWLRQAIELAGRCPPSRTAFSVGAVVVDENGQELAHGYSRDTDAHVHAEESALSELVPGDPRLATATIYSSLEPCTVRKSRPRTCTQLIIAAGLARVVFAWREPALFVADCQGAETLTAAGIEIVEYPELTAAARAANSHLPGIGSAQSAPRCD